MKLIHLCRPSFRRPWRGRGRAIPITYTYSAEEVRAESLSHPDNIVNKFRLREDRPASIVAIDEPLYPRSKRSTSVPEYVSKCADEQVSKGTEVQLRSLTSAQVLEDTGEKELEKAIAEYTKILKDYDAFGKQCQKSAKPVVLKFEEIRKPDTKGKEYTKRQEKRTSNVGTR